MKINLNRSQSLVYLFLKEFGDGKTINEIHKWYKDNLLFTSIAKSTIKDNLSSKHFNYEMSLTTVVKWSLKPDVIYVLDCLVVEPEAMVLFDLEKLASERLILEKSTPVALLINSSKPIVTNSIILDRLLASIKGVKTVNQQLLENYLEFKRSTVLRAV